MIQGNSNQVRDRAWKKGTRVRCQWSDGMTVGRVMSVSEIMDEILEEKDFYDASGGGLTLSGGEPLMQWEATRELLKKARESGLNTAVETSGYASATVVEAVAEFSDLWLYDIKGIDPVFHRTQTRVANSVILRNLKWLDAHGDRIVLRCPMIPGVNDFDMNLLALGKQADDLKNVERIDIEPFLIDFPPVRPA